MPKLVIIGDVGLDLVMGPLDHWPDAGTETMVDRADMRCGFSAANSALAAAALGQDCALFGAVGDDHFGAWLDKALAHVDHHLAVVEDAPTTLSVAVVRSDGERSFLTTRGHLDYIQPALILDRVPTAAAGDIALITGYFLLPGLREGFDRTLMHLRALGYRIAVDTGWPSDGWDDDVRRTVFSWLALCDILLLNEIEVAHLAQQADVQQALMQLARAMAPGATAVAKLGAKGAAAAQNDTIAQGSAPAVTLFDTVGAGDSFNAAFLSACQSGLPLARALRAACLGASSILAHFPRAAIAPGALAWVIQGKDAA